MSALTNAFLVFIAVTAAMAVPAGASNQCPNGATIVTELGHREQVPEVFAPIGGGVVAYPSPAQVNARYVRVRFTVTDVPNCQWFFTVRDPDQRPIEVFGKDDFQTGNTRWTHRVSGAQALFDLVPCDGDRAPKIKLEEYVWMPVGAANPYYSLQTQLPAYREITTVDSALRRLGDVTAFLVSSWDRSSWVCTGVMLTPTLLLTNWHCGGPPTLPDNGFWNADIVRDTFVDLSFDGDTHSRELQITSLATTPNKSLDFVVLRTEAIDELGPVRPVKISTTAPAAKLEIRIVHHPAGKVKQLSWNCVIRQPDYKGWQNAAVQSEFTHACDTEGGSSGAPILDSQGALLGLHHLGFDYDAQKCVQTDRENKAVKIAAILDAIRQDKQNIFDEIMRWQSR
jgi:V8-like Glu-specific endopeptidase